MVYFESFGENDFASIFPSVAQERREEEERRQTEIFLRLLDEIEENKAKEESRHAQHQVIPSHRIEHAVAINSDGDIVHRPEPTVLKQGYVDRKKIHTLDDLPRESEWEQIFGPAPEPEPQVKVQGARRLQDGKKVYRAFVPGETSYFQWSGLSMESFILLLFAGLVIILLLMRGRSRRRKQSAPNNRRHVMFMQQPIVHHTKQLHPDTTLEQIIEAKVERRVKEHIKRMEIKASDFC